MFLGEMSLELCPSLVCFILLLRFLACIVQYACIETQSVGSVDNLGFNVRLIALDDIGSSILQLLLEILNGQVGIIGRVHTSVVFSELHWGNHVIILVKMIQQVQRGYIGLSNNGM
jgi:hypothetical protein